MKLSSKRLLSQTLAVYAGTDNTEKDTGNRMFQWKRRLWQFNLGGGHSTGWVDTAAYSMFKVLENND